MGHVFFGLLLGLLRKAEILLSHRITKGVFTALAVFLDLGFAGVTFAGSFEWRRLKDSSGFGLPLSDIDSRRFRIQLFAHFMFATGCAEHSRCSPLLLCSPCRSGIAGRHRSRPRLFGQNAHRWSPPQIVTMKSAAASVDYRSIFDSFFLPRGEFAITGDQQVSCWIYRRPVSPYAFCSTLAEILPFPRQSGS